MTTPYRGAASRPLVVVAVWMGSRVGHDILAGASDFGYSRGWRILRVDITAGMNAGVISQMNPSGLVVQLMSRTFVPQIRALALPTVNVSNGIADSEFPSVVSDDRLVGRLAADYFLAKGYKHFAFCGETELRTCALRLEGFRSTLASRSLAPQVMSEGIDFNRVFLSPQLFEGVRNWLLGLPKPVAIFAWSDTTAEALLEISQQAGLRVPQDIALLGVNDDYAANLTPQSAVSSIRLNAREMGYRAARALQRILSSRNAPSGTEHVAPIKVVERRSSEHYNVSDPSVNEALRYIRTNLADTLDVSELASKVGLSRRVLEKRFRAALGASPYDRILHYRIEKAKDLILSTSLKMEEIANLCGFIDGRHLSIIFRKRTGTSPSSLRSHLAI